MFCTSFLAKSCRSSCTWRRELSAVIWLCLGIGGCLFSFGLSSLPLRPIMLCYFALVTLTPDWSSKDCKQNNCRLASSLKLCTFSILEVWYFHSILTKMWRLWNYFFMVSMVVSLSFLRKINLFLQRQLTFSDEPWFLSALMMPGAAVSQSLKTCKAREAADSCSRYWGCVSTPFIAVISG